MDRAAGVLMHITSLPSKYGIGTLGQEAYKFADFLKASEQTYWQILPVGQTSYGDSPYQALSSYAGNPYFIDLDMLCDDGLLEKKEYTEIDWGKDLYNVDYGKIFNSRFKVLRIAFNRASKKKDKNFEVFKDENAYWLKDYSLYMAVKNYFNLKAWTEWDEDIRLREPAALERYSELLKDDIEFYNYIQYLFFSQWHKLKKYVNSLGISIIGDMPIYVALDSADTWANPNVFWLDKENKPVCVAGCPPDNFAKTGQLWGNPLYNWDYLKNTNYKWWIDRLKGSQKLYDVLRIDHFRGFDEYYAVPAENDTAVHGKWLKGPGMDFFKIVNEEINNIEIIAEDLGFLTDTVVKLLNDTGYPGMKILEFAFSGDNNTFLPHNYNKNSVVYTGTHDNDTVMGWLKNADEKEKKFAESYAVLSEKEGYNWGFIRLAYASVSNLAIIPMQDFLGLDSDSRMNIPSTVCGNWQFRIDTSALTTELSEKIQNLTKIYGRCKKIKKQDKIKR